MQWDIGIEMGETGVRLATREKGVVLTSPSLGAARDDKVIAMGDEARAMVGRTPRSIVLSRPVHAGALSDARLAAQWLTRLMEPFTSSSKIHKPNVLFADTGLFKPSEWELLRNALMELGAAQIGRVRMELLSGLGADLPVHRPEGQLIVGAGAGILFASLIAFGRVVETRCLPYGFSRIDEELAVLLRRECGLAAGERTCEELKLALCSALPARDIHSPAVGLNMRTGFPDEADVSAELAHSACEPIVQALITLIQSVISLAPDELCADLLENGVTLTGGGARLSGLDKRISEACALPCHVCDAPERAAINGMARLLASPELIDIIQIL